MTATPYTTTLAATSLALICSCAAPPPAQTVEPNLPDPGPDGTYEAELPQPKPGEVRSLVMMVSEDVQHRCNFTPHFEFDVQKPLPQGHAKIAALAGCLNHEQIRDFDVLIVGHADARGTDQYNAKLGQKRAKQVKQLLVEQGVDPARIEVESRGERDAKGDQAKYSHGYDRRVDISLVGQDRAPVMSGVKPGMPGQGTSP